MYGDTPPTVVVIDDALLRSPALGSRLRMILDRQPCWFVASDPSAVQRALDVEGVHVDVAIPETDGSIFAGAAAALQGDLVTAVRVARNRGNREVRVWLGGQDMGADVDMKARIMAHDEGVLLRIEAPLAAA